MSDVADCSGVLADFFACQFRRPPPSRGAQVIETMANPDNPKAAQPAAGGHTATVGAADHGHTAVFPPFDKTTFAPQLIWLALAFGFLYYALSKHLLPKISTAIEGRAEGIRADLAEAEHLKQATEASLKAYDEALGVAKADASGIAKTQQAAIASEADRERVAAEAQATAKVAAAEKQIAASKATALAAVNDVANQTVGAIVAKLTGQNVSGDEVAKAIAAVTAK